MESLMPMLIRLAAAFPRDNVPRSTIEVYAFELGNLDISLMDSVIRGAINGYSRFPTIAQLRQSYDDERERRAQQDREQSHALPESMEGAVPMPAYVKKQVEELKRKMDGRSKELEPPDEAAS